MNRFSPLRYPGGKGKLAAYITDLASKNGLVGGHYAEPFAGGAAVALDLLFSGVVKHVHINDLDPCVHAFWNSAVVQTDAFVELIFRTDVTIDAWKRARETKQRWHQFSELEVGFATFFLSRTNRSGILNGGPIGGLQQEGKWKLDCRFNKSELASRVRRIGFFRSRITVTGLDAKAFLTEARSSLPENTLWYIDPPYYQKGATLYKNHFTHADHVELAEQVFKLPRGRWIVSYDNAPEISQIYGDYEQEIFSVNYTARSYSRGSEIMIFAPGVSRPGSIYCSEKERLARALVA